jgi:hypothetical protein
MIDRALAVARPAFDVPREPDRDRRGSPIIDGIRGERERSDQTEGEGSGEHGPREFVSVRRPTPPPMAARGSERPDQK